MGCSSLKIHMYMALVVLFKAQSLDRGHLAVFAGDQHDKELAQRLHLCDGLALQGPSSDYAN